MNGFGFQGSRLGRVLLFRHITITFAPLASCTMQVLQETADAWEGGNENVPHIMYEADEEKVYDCK